MATTYADLAAQPRYADAIAFFLSDLYGGADFAQRDADLARVVPDHDADAPRARDRDDRATRWSSTCFRTSSTGALLSRLPRSRRHLHRRRVLPRVPVGGRPPGARAADRTHRANRRRPRRIRGEAVHPVGARDDAAPGKHRRPVRAARFSGAGLPRVPQDGRRRASSWRRSTGASASSWPRSTRARTRPFAEPVLPEAPTPDAGRAARRGAGRPKVLPTSRLTFVLPKYLSNCLCTSASMVGFSSDSMNPSSQSRRTASLPTWSAPLRPGRLNSM